VRKNARALALIWNFEISGLPRKGVTFAGEWDFIMRGMPITEDRAKQDGLIPTN
jgi:hypothetical protein